MQTTAIAATAATISRIPARVDAGLRAAFVLANAVAWAVSLFRPISLHIEPAEDEEGPELVHPNVYVQPLAGASLFRLACWRATDGRESWIEVRAFGCAIEVFYVPQAAQGATAVGTEA